jgi:hypothetical protein
MRTAKTWLGFAMPLLVLVATGPVGAERQAAQAQTPPQGSAQPAELPAAREVLDRHLKAIGGSEAILARSSSHAVGTIEVPASGLKGTIELFQAKPNRSLMRTSVAGLGDIQEGFNGTIGWMISPITGPLLLQGKQLEQRKLDSDFYSDIKPESRYESVTVVEKTVFEGRPCYKIRLAHKGGGEDFQFYDADTGLRSGSITTRETPMGSITGTTVESDYKRFGKILYPTKLTISAMGLQQILMITTVEYDRVDPSVFEPPDTIKAMIK